MPSVDSVYRTYDEIVSDLLAAWATRIPDISIGPGSIVRIWSEVFASSAEGFFLGLQLLHDDMFIQSMSALALQRKGEQLGRTQKGGTLATGTVRLEGAGGTVVPTGSLVGAPRPLLADTLVFQTTADVTIPDPGVPIAPLASDAGSAGNVSGTVEYAVTFTTSEGETAIGFASNALTVTSRQVDVGDIPVGGPGTTGRSIYRRTNGGNWAFVDTLDDNATTDYVDNIASGSLGGTPPTESTAERVTIGAQASEAGIDYNVGVGTITTLVDVSGDVTGVTNTTAFTGGTDVEAVEEFRAALLDWAANPHSGSTNDLIAWATSVDGVETAAVFKNVDLSGNPERGSVVVKISGPGSTVPGADVIEAVQEYLDSKVLANITIYVGTFTGLTVDVDVQVAPLPGYTIDDVTPSVLTAIEDYVNGVEVGGVVYVAGLYHAIYSLPGVRTLVVNLPSADVEAGVDEKPTVTSSDITIAEETWP